MFMSYIALAIVITAIPSIILIDNAYSIEYSGQTSNTGNSVSSEWITLEFYTSLDGYEFTETNLSLLAPEITYTGETTMVVDGTYTLTPENLYVRISENYTSSTNSTYTVESTIDVKSNDISVNGVTNNLSFYSVQNGAVSIDPSPTLSPDTYYRMHLSLTFNESVISSNTLENTVTLTARDSRTENANSMTAEYHDFKSYSVNIQFTSNVAQQIYNGINNGNNSTRFNVVEENGEIYISSVDSSNGSIASNGTIGATIEGLHDISICIHVQITAGNGAQNSTELGIRCITVDENDPNKKQTELGSLSWPIKNSNITIDRYVGYNGKLIEMNKSDVDAGNNYLTIGGNTTLTIELTGEEHSHAVIKVSIIPLQDTPSS